MSEASTKARLVGTRDMFTEKAGTVTATVPREGVADALTSDPPAELVLEVWRAADAGGLEKHKVNVAWKREDLESLLADLEGDAIAFSFDREELERAIENPDVEGHGLRETAVVLSIAAAAAAGASSASAAVHAQAEVSPRATVQQAAEHDEMTMAARGIESEPAAPVHDEMTMAARGIEPGPVAASHDEMTMAARGIESEPAAPVHDEMTMAARGIEPGHIAATHDETTLAARGIEPGHIAATHDETTLAARGIEPGHIAATHDETTLAARGIEPGHIAATHDETTLAARGITPESPVVADTGSGFDFPGVDSGLAAGIAGGLAGAGLVIAAATFATRRRQPGAA